ncbi:hypothetical protein PROAA_210043 [Candidatus Propionivibrio aalborgensis]|uniref:Uncharacterized protein n=1 Tax=Candidatus Propionivibrio aalborgensis TaxID=1860101 RepID=A0A1A8XR83_9RHOO|nr:hypothetical protein PROAA_210043 [Candidatus Propionivibrio aalborgensis]
MYYCRGNQCWTVGLTLRVWTLSESKKLIDWDGEGSACSRISGIWCGLAMVRADMESAHVVAITTSGRQEVAGGVIPQGFPLVIGVNPCGCDPFGHDG